MCFTGAIFVYFFVCETQGRTLEEIDTMYVSGVKPWQSSKWHPAARDDDSDRVPSPAGLPNGKKEQLGPVQHRENIANTPNAGSAYGARQ